MQGRPCHDRAATVPLRWAPCTPISFRQAARPAPGAGHSAWRRFAERRMDEAGSLHSPNRGSVPSIAHSHSFRTAPDIRDPARAQNCDKSNGRGTEHPARSHSSGVGVGIVDETNSIGNLPIQAISIKYQSSFLPPAPAERRARRNTYRHLSSGEVPKLKSKGPGMTKKFSRENKDFTPSTLPGASMQTKQQARALQLSDSRLATYTQRGESRDVTTL